MTERRSYILAGLRRASKAVKQLAGIQNVDSDLDDDSLPFPVVMDLQIFGEPTERHFPIQFKITDAKLVDWLVKLGYGRVEDLKQRSLDWIRDVTQIRRRLESLREDGKEYPSIAHLLEKGWQDLTVQELDSIGPRALTPMDYRQRGFLETLKGEEKEQQPNHSIAPWIEAVLHVQRVAGNVIPKLLTKYHRLSQVSCTKKTAATKSIEEAWFQRIVEEMDEDIGGWARKQFEKDWLQGTSRERVEDLVQQYSSLAKKLGTNVLQWTWNLDDSNFVDNLITLLYLLRNKSTITMDPIQAMIPQESLNDDALEDIYKLLILTTPPSMWQTLQIPKSFIPTSIPRIMYKQCMESEFQEALKLAKTRQQVQVQQEQQSEQAIQMGKQAGLDSLAKVSELEAWVEVVRGGLEDFLSTLDLGDVRVVQISPDKLK